MTSTWHSNSLSDVHKHPDDSILLAYLRGQKFETYASIIQHIENEKCPVCFQKLNGLQQVTNVLDVLGTMRSYQYYPELIAEDSFARIEGIAHQRISAKTAKGHIKYPPRPRKSAIRLISVPFGVGLALIFTAMVVFASLTGRMPIPFSSHGQISPHPTALTVVVNPHSAPIQQPKATATGVVPPEIAPEAKAPHMKVCSSKDDIAQLQLVICGFSFDSMHKATLLFYVPAKGFFWLRNIPVDKHGKIHVEWNIVNCGNMPTYIYGYEAGSKPIKVVRITSFGACVAPTTPVVKPRWPSPKLDI